MSLLINPGSHIPEAQSGWTNTLERARYEAALWYNRMLTDGFVDIELVEGSKEPVEGRWTFLFRHTITGKAVKLETHGIDDLDAYRKQAIFDPRVYWNGSSSSEPQLEDFAAEGYVMAKTYRAAVG